MISAGLQQQIQALCESHPPAKPVIEALIAHYSGPQNSSASSVPEDAIQYEEMSMILPNRRKCTLNIHDSGLWLTAGGVIILESKWSDILRVACLPVTDKAKPTWNLIFAKVDPQHTIVLALNQVSADKFRKNAKPTSLRESLIGDIELRSSFTVDQSFFANVSAHIGSKEGMLYFLDDALIYGHKKPILFLPHSDIVSFSFTVVTRSTFNVVVKMEDDTSYEFSMIDQDHFPKISKYVMIHSLPDESLAEDRAAKRSRHDDDDQGESLAGDAISNVRIADDDDRESDLDVEFSDRELDSDGSGASEVEQEDDSDAGSEAAEDEVDLEQTSDVDDEIDFIQSKQLEDQSQDEQEEEQGFNTMDAFDTNFD